MDILRNLPDGTCELVGRRCDRCRHEARASRSLEEQFEICEFVTVEVNAGYGADYFTDGDSRVADLCERCVHQMLSPYLRLVRSYQERDLETEAIAAKDSVPLGVTGRQTFLLRFREDSPNGVTSSTLWRAAADLNMTESQLLHTAVREYIRRHLLPRDIAIPPMTIEELRELVDRKRG